MSKRVGPKNNMVRKQNCHKVSDKSGNDYFVKNNPEEQPMDALTPLEKRKREKEERYKQLQANRMMLAVDNA